VYDDFLEIDKERKINVRGWQFLSEKQASFPNPYVEKDKNSMKVFFNIHISPILFFSCFEYVHSSLFDAEVWIL